MKKIGDDDGSAKNGSVDKKHLVAEAKVSTDVQRID